MQAPQAAAPLFPRGVEHWTQAEASCALPSALPPMVAILARRWEGPVIRNDRDPGWRTCAFLSQGFTSKTRKATKKNPILRNPTMSLSCMPP
jgi:hypothetical protein